MRKNIQLIFPSICLMLLSLNNGFALDGGLSSKDLDFYNSHLASETFSVNYNISGGSFCSVESAQLEDELGNLLSTDDIPDWLVVNVNISTPTISITCLQNPASQYRSHNIFIRFGANAQPTNRLTITVNQNPPLSSYIWYPDTDGDTFGDYLANGIVHTSNTNPPSQYPNYVNNNLDYCPDEPHFVNNGCAPGFVFENRNWITAKSYDINGVLKAKTKAYFNELGKSEQSQSVDIETGKTWASQTLYDAQGRSALSTLSAPINDTGNFLYDENFIKNEIGNNFTNADFETDIDNPSKVSAIANTLGWYYSTQNTDAFHEGNDYQDITEYPFSRTIYSDLNPGAALRVLGGNKVDTDGDGTIDGWLQQYSFSMKAGQELTQAAAFNDISYDTAGDTRKILKTVVRDVHGVENVVFTDTDGKTLAAARVGGTNITNSTVSIGEQGFVDIHVPEGTAGFTINGVTGINTEVYNLITEQLETGATTSFSNGFYRVSITNLDDYNPTDALNTVSITYQDNYYDYSLNYYDAVGRLISSKQPLNHIETTYEYNALGQLTSTTSPDEGTANFKYRKDGQIRFSQNSKQQDPNGDSNLNDAQFSYTNYDRLGRPIESGVFSSPTLNFNNTDAIIDNIDYPETTAIDEDGLIDSNCTEQHFTQYDNLETNELANTTGLHSDYHNPTFLSGNVAKTENDQTTTYYSYDIYGRVQWIVQNILDLGVKTIDYEYDPITSQVNRVIYQKHNANELFIHRYTYDPIDNGLVMVETSLDDITYTEHATYNYYETGGLRNIILAEGIQKIDYVYNLAGQLKGINHPNLIDADNPSNNNDLFGMSIDYYTNDYKRTNAFNNTVPSADQFNGNIKGITWNTGPNLGQNPVQYAYEYNRNNWLTEAKFNGNGNITGVLEEDIIISSPGNPDQTVQAGTSITFMPGFEVIASSGTVFIAEIVEDNTGSTIEDDDYKVHGITYDANGNIETLNRNKNTQNGSNAMDALTYNYNLTKPNQLQQVIDTEGDAGVGDIGAQTNYTYNAIGQLVNSSDGTDTNTYFYNASGLVTEIKQNSISRIKFYYNDKNHRVKKESFNVQQNSPQLLSTTYYVRDASGTALAIYEKQFQGAVALKEHTIYGASRLGVHYRESDTDAYQLTDHLGNVRAVIVKNGENAVSLTSKTDYYPFGMPMPDRNDGANSYRYAFQGQEKDAETGMEAFELRLWDSRIGRWLTTDPMREFVSPYLGMGNNPIRLIDPDGGMTEDNIYFNDDGTVARIETNGDPNRFFDSEGNEMFFNAADELDANMLTRKFKIDEQVYFQVSKSEIISMIASAGFEPLQYNAKAAMARKNGNNNSAIGYKASAMKSAADNSFGDKPADFTMSQLKPRYNIRGRSSIYDAYNETAAYFRFGNADTIYNWFDAGNHIWGSWMQANGFSMDLVILGSQYFAIYEMGHLFGDTKADQNAIINGYLHKGF